MRRAIVLSFGALLIAGCSPSTGGRHPTSPRVAAVEPEPAKLTPASRIEAARERAAPSATAKPDSDTPSAAPGPCPMNVTGASVAVDELEDGGALVFTTAGDLIELRRVIARTAAKHRSKPALRQARSRLDNVDRGIRIVFTSSSPERVHQELSEYAKELAKRCAMALTEYEPGLANEPETPPSSSTTSVDVTPPPPEESTPKPEPADEKKPEATAPEKPAQDKDEASEEPEDKPAGEDAPEPDEPPKDDDINFDDDEPYVIPE